MSNYVYYAELVLVRGYDSMLEDITEKMPIFYGSVTVGERGQVAIPA